MPKIQETIEIDSSRDRVWEIISDLDNEGEYWWGTKEVRNISKQGNTIERAIVQNFRNHEIYQRVTLRPKTEIEVRYIKGLTEGVKLLRLESLSEDRQKLVAYWDVHFPGVYRLFSPLIARHVRRGTIGALSRIRDVAEGRPIVCPEGSRSQVGR